MKIILKSIFFLVILISLSACKSDQDKAEEIINKAQDSPITELETPYGFKFNMTEKDFELNVNRFSEHEIDGKTYRTYTIGNNIYAGDFGKSKFYKGKLCSYEIYVDKKVVNGSLKDLIHSDLDTIATYYKNALGDDSEMEYFPDWIQVWDRYLLTKGNLLITICWTKSTGTINITCENAPSSCLVEDKDDSSSSNEPSYYGTSDDGSTYVPSVEVKNNKWNGGVKQVEDYLESTLRDPDSYESIEWSEVKTKSDGYYVRHKYRAKNGFGGYVVANQLFHLDFNGNVVGVKDLY